MEVKTVRWEGLIKKISIIVFLQEERINRDLLVGYKIYKDLKPNQINPRKKFKKKYKKKSKRHAGVSKNLRSN